MMSNLCNTNFIVVSSISVVIFNVCRESALTRLQFSKDRWSSGDYQHSEKNATKNVVWLHLAALNRRRLVSFAEFVTFFISQYPTFFYPSFCYPFSSSSYPSLVLPLSLLSLLKCFRFLSRSTRRFSFPSMSDL